MFFASCILEYEILWTYSCFEQNVHNINERILFALMKDADKSESFNSVPLSLRLAALKIKFTNRSPRIQEIQLNNSFFFP